MKQSNIGGYLLVAPLESKRCDGCAFLGTGVASHTDGCGARYLDRRCTPAYDDGAEDSIYIEDTDEAKAAYVRARLGLTTP
jgi:hypothetical protein